LEPFELLVEGAVAIADTPDELSRLYCGPLGFASPVVYSNFVETLDGVVALEDRRSSGSVISGHHEGDRFLMGLLRACADAVLLGAGTLRATPNHRWTAEAVAPAYADDFAELRRRRSLAPEPRLVLVTGRGDIDPSHPALPGALVLTTAATAHRLRRRLPSSCEVIVAGAEVVDIGGAVDTLHREGMPTVLTEGGPTLMGELLGAQRLDEAFITLAPVLAGRSGPGRLGMVENASLLPNDDNRSTLLSARRQGDYLFLRYAVEGGRL
jgi:riboflavin biosynthesis pyrimidine reductase